MFKTICFVWTFSIWEINELLFPQNTNWHLTVPVLTHFTIHSCLFRRARAQMTICQVTADTSVLTWTICTIVDFRFHWSTGSANFVHNGWDLYHCGHFKNHGDFCNSWCLTFCFRCRWLNRWDFILTVSTVESTATLAQVPITKISAGSAILTGNIFTVVLS